MSWDDGKHTKVKRVQLTFDDVINSIQVEYDGTNLQSQRRGTVGAKSDGFTLSPDEYITEVTGYSKTTFSGDVITALTFKTNKKTYGPYGNKTRSFFSVNAPTNNQIAGFLGTSGNALNSIDVHFAPIPPPGSTDELGSKPGGPETNPGSKPGDPETDPGSKPGGPGGVSNPDSNPQKLDAQGGKEGNQWDDGADHDGVTKIHVVTGGQGVAQIRFDYFKNGQIKEGPVHGVKGARDFTSTFEINHPSEYLVSVKGWYDSSNKIQGIQFKTNTQTSQYFVYEFGGDGTEFSLEVKDKKIVGFHGFADTYLNSLGAYFAPISSSSSSPTPLKPAKKLKAVGGEEGATWDDGVFDGVRKVNVGQNNDGVSFVTVEYAKGSQTIIGDGHGKESELGVETFELDYPSEYITSVEVYFDRVQVEERGVTLVTSLIFKTNKQTSPPFGMAAGEKLELKEEGHKIVGFHGKASDWVHQIGVYVAPITN